LRSAVHLHVFAVQELPEKSDSLGICRGGCLFFFEMSPHHDFGLSGGRGRLKFQAALGGCRGCFVQVPEALIFV